jgi:hypothetical protein
MMHKYLLGYPGLQPFCLMAILRYTCGILLENMFAPACGRHGEREIVSMCHQIYNIM